MPATDRHVGQTIAGKYLVERSLGHGGMGEVYVAVQAPLGRRVALKLVRRDMADDDRAMARFEREAQALAQLTDPHIVMIHDFGVAEGGELFMAMELVDGESLRQRIRKEGGALEPLTALRVAHGICGALAAAHHAGVVHRDLKPENVMLTHVSSSGALAGMGADFVKVLDFGVARISDKSKGTTPATLTETGKLVGTPGYMAPEMLLYGVLDDPRSDLYAVGVMLFEMLTGEALFTAPTPIALVMKHAHEAPRRVGDVIDTFPSEVESLVHDLLRKEPAERPPTAAAVMDRLAKIIAAPASLPATKAKAKNIDVNAKTVAKMATPQGPALPPSATAMTEPDVAILPPAVASRGVPRVLMFGAALVVAVGVGALGMLAISKGAEGAEPGPQVATPQVVPPQVPPPQVQPQVALPQVAPVLPPQDMARAVVLEEKVVAPPLEEKPLRREIRKKKAEAKPAEPAEKTPASNPSKPHEPDLSVGHQPDLK